jgi:hypothetical protein
VQLSAPLHKFVFEFLCRAPDDLKLLVSCRQALSHATQRKPSDARTQAKAQHGNDEIPTTHPGHRNSDSSALVRDRENGRFHWYERVLAIFV